jgi:hypothetical protein
LGCLKGVAPLGLREGVQKGLIVCGIAEDGSAIVAPVQVVIDQVVGNGSGEAWHKERLVPRASAVKQKMN